EPRLRELTRRDAGSLPLDWGGDANGPEVGYVCPIPAGGRRVVRDPGRAPEWQGGGRLPRRSPGVFREAELGRDRRAIQGRTLAEVPHEPVSCRQQRLSPVLRAVSVPEMERGKSGG